MSQLNSSNCDSQGIKYTLNSSTNTAVISDIPDHRGLFARYEGTIFRMISVGSSHLNPQWLIETYGVEDDGVGCNNRRGSVGIQYLADGAHRQYWLIDSNGRIYNNRNRGRCLYHSGTDMITMYPPSNIGATDTRAQWIFDGTYIYTRNSFDRMIEVYNNTYKTFNYVFMNTNNGNAWQKWYLNITSGSMKPEIQYTINRGVMDTNGNIYKVIGTSVDRRFMTGHKFYFPHHVSGEVSGTTNMTCVYGK